MRAQPLLLLPRLVGMTVTLMLPRTLRRQGNTLREGKAPTGNRTAGRWPGSPPRTRLPELGPYVRGLLSTDCTPGAALGAGDSTVNRQNPCPQGADLLWGRGILRNRRVNRKFSLGSLSQRIPAVALGLLTALSCPCPETALLLLQKHQTTILVTHKYWDSAAQAFGS